MSKSKSHQRTGIVNKRHSAPNQTGYLVIVGIAAIVLIVLMMLASRQNGQPDFTASTLSGEPVHLSDYHGQVVMLNFWATWCPPCRAEMPAIQAAYEQYHDQGFMVLAINNAEQPDQIQPFADAFALRFPVVLDTQGRLSQIFGVNGYPTSLFIAPDGEIYARHSGMLTPQQLERYITDGLAKIFH